MESLVRWYPWGEDMKIDVGYQSPVVRYDPLARTEIFETRNVLTGVVAYQDPSAATVKRLEDVPAEATAPQAAVAPKPWQGATETAGGISLIV
jgi:hypothetical protein